MKMTQSRRGGLHVEEADAASTFRPHTAPSSSLWALTGPSQSFSSIIESNYKIRQKMFRSSFISVALLAFVVGFPNGMTFAPPVKPQGTQNLRPRSEYRDLIVSVSF